MPASASWATLDGKATGDGRASGADGALHPVQQAMVDCHGSQCGFCTPGFVMSLYGAVAATETRRAGRRSTGAGRQSLPLHRLRPIVEAAGRRMWPGDPAAGGPPRRRCASMAGCGAEDDETLRSADGARRFARPGLEALAALVLAHPEATSSPAPPMSGCGSPSSSACCETVIYLGRVADLRRIARPKDGASRSAPASLCRRHRRPGRAHPDLGELLRRIGGSRCANAGTIGGNIANGSPIGDTPPALIALGATWCCAGAMRAHLPLEDFFIAYGKQDRQPGEFVEPFRARKLRDGDPIPRLQDHQALRPGHLGRLRRLPADAGGRQGRRHPHRLRRHGRHPKRAPGRSRR
jgi:xanthine dehydrogenase small subunit